MEEAACIWGTSCQTDSLCPRLQGGRNSALRALWRQSCAGYEAPGGIPGAGSPLASTETVPGIATTDFSFCGKSHPLSKTLLWGPEWTADLKNSNFYPQMEISHISIGRTLIWAIQYWTFHVPGEGNVNLCIFFIMFPTCNSASTLQ